MWTVCGCFCCYFSYHTLMGFFFIQYIVDTSHEWGISLKWNTQTQSVFVVHDDNVCFFFFFFFFCFLYVDVLKITPCYHFIIRFCSLVFVLFRNFCCCCCFHVYHYYYTRMISKPNEVFLRFFCVLLLSLLFLFVALNWIANEYTYDLSFSKLTLTPILFANLWRLWIWLFWVQFAFLVQHTHLKHFYPHPSLFLSLSVCTCSIQM